MFTMTFHKANIDRWHGNEIKTMTKLALEVQRDDTGFQKRSTNDHATDVMKHSDNRYEANCL